MDRADKKLPDVLERAWGELEKSVEVAVQRALQRVKVPRRDEVAALQARLERLAARIDALAGER